MGGKLKCLILFKCKINLFTLLRCQVLYSKQLKTEHDVWKIISIIKAKNVKNVRKLKIIQIHRT